MLGSLKQYVLVSQDTKDVAVFTRGATGWDEPRFGPGEEVELVSVSASFGVDELYAGAQPG